MNESSSKGAFTRLFVKLLFFYVMRRRDIQYDEVGQLAASNLL